MHKNSNKHFWNLAHSLTQQIVRFIFRVFFLYQAYTINF